MSFRGWAESWSHSLIFMWLRIWEHSSVCKSRCRKILRLTVVFSKPIFGRFFALTEREDACISNSMPFQVQRKSRGWDPAIFDVPILEGETIIVLADFHSAKANSCKATRSNKHAEWKMHITQVVLLLLQVWESKRDAKNVWKFFWAQNAQGALITSLPFPGNYPHSKLL